jgi:hypothetical protein
MRPGLKIVYISGFAANTIAQSRNYELPLALLPKPYTISELSRKAREVQDGGVAQAPT